MMQWLSLGLLLGTFIWALANMSPEGSRLLALGMVVLWNLVLFGMGAERPGYQRWLGVLLVPTIFCLGWTWGWGTRSAALGWGAMVVAWAGTFLVMAVEGPERERDTRPARATPRAPLLVVPSGPPPLLGQGQVRGGTAMLVGGSPSEHLKRN
jgi:hypothetical protein